eukprot:30980-Pelagococcus_subviridis.AAC.41
MLLARGGSQMIRKHLLLPLVVHESLPPFDPLPVLLLTDRLETQRLRAADRFEPPPFRDFLLQLDLHQPQALAFFRLRLFELFPPLHSQLVQLFVPQSPPLRPRVFRLRAYDRLRRVRAVAAVAVAARAAGREPGAAGVESDRPPPPRPRGFPPAEGVAEGTPRVPATGERPAQRVDGAAQHRGRGDETTVRAPVRPCVRGARRRCADRSRPARGNPYSLSNNMRACNERRSDRRRLETARDGEVRWHRADDRVLAEGAK